MSEEAKVTAKENPTMRGVLFWLSSVSAVFVLGVGAYAVYSVRQYVPVVGYVFLISLGLLPAIGIMWGLIALARHFFKADYIEIGPSGTLIKRFNKVTEYHPLGVKEHRGNTARTKVIEALPEIPSLLTLLQEGLLGGVRLLLGYHKDGSQRWGTWDDIRTFVVAGKSRSGKTVTMVFFILQALLAGAEVWVCDPHHNKRTGLLKVLQPLVPFLQVAGTHVEILQLVTRFKNEMNARENNSSEMGLKPILLVIDEWTKLLRDLDSVEMELIVNTILDTAEAWANFEGYAMIAGHEWTARESGGKKGASIRRAFHAAYVHRIDEDYAKFLLVGSKGRKVAKTAPNLPTGHAHYLDSDGELDYMIIPYYGEKKEAIQEVATMLQALPPGVEYPQIEGPGEGYYKTSAQPVNNPVNGKQTVNDGVNKPVKPGEALTPSVYNGVNIIELEKEENPVNDVRVNGFDLKTLIERLRKQGVPHHKIAPSLGMGGRHYTSYQTFCRENGIPLEDVAISNSK